MFGRLQAELLQNSFGFERRGVAAASQQHVEAESLLSCQSGAQTTLRWQVSDAGSVLIFATLIIEQVTL